MLFIPTVEIAWIDDDLEMFVFLILLVKLFYFVISNSIKKAWLF